jgi:transcriptional regulator with XRE-family HTH domain
MNPAPPKIWAMAQKPTNARRRARPVPPPLHIGEWIRALGMRPADIARATGRNEGYLSEIINGRKTRPSLGLQQEIADALGIPVHYFLRQPPPKDFIEEARMLDPAVIDRLRRQ